MCLCSGYFWAAVKIGDICGLAYPFNYGKFILLSTRSKEIQRLLLHKLGEVFTV